MLCFLNLLKACRVDLLTSISQPTAGQQLVPMPGFVIYIASNLFPI